MSFDPRSSFEYLCGLLQSHNPEIMSLLMADDANDFADAVEQGLARAVVTIEGGAKYYGALDEPALSLLLADLMNHSGFSATAERNSNGHCDVVVEHLLRGRWRYLGECKIHRTPQYHQDGCEQVLGYCGGQELRAFCLDFFKKGKMHERLVLMRSHFDSNMPLGQVGQSRDHAAIRGGFSTRHAHRSGSEIDVLHLGCNVSMGDDVE